MKIKRLEQSVVEIPCTNTNYHIERCARVCTRTMYKTGTGDTPKFVDGLLKKEHLSVFEHGALYLHIPQYLPIVEFFKRNPYSRVKLFKNKKGDMPRGFYITTNLRVWAELEKRAKTDKSIAESLKGTIKNTSKPNLPTERHELMRSFLITTDRGTASQIRTYNTLSHLQESTRYVNLDKMGAEFSITEAYEKSDKRERRRKDRHSMRCLKEYRRRLKRGEKPEDARDALPHDLNTRVILTGFEDRLMHFVNTRRREKNAQGNIAKIALVIKESITSKKE